MSAEPATFADKLLLVLKLLAISRGRLAADVGLDKSVVSRWLSGRTVPSGENLSRLTRFIAGHWPGFSGVHWDLAPPALAALFGSTSLPDSGSGPLGMLHLPPASAPQLAATEGHWHAWRILAAGGVQRDVVRIRRKARHVGVDWACGPMRGTGEMRAGIGAICLIISVNYVDVPQVTWLNAFALGRMQVMDGIFCGVVGPAARGMVSGSYVWTRHADLLSDEAADDRLFAYLAKDRQQFDEAEIPPGIVGRLNTATASSSQFYISSERSLARLSTAADDAASAAVSTAFLAGCAG